MGQWDNFMLVSVKNEKAQFLDWKLKIDTAGGNGGYLFSAKLFLFLSQDIMKMCSGLPSAIFCPSDRELINHVVSVVTFICSTKTTFSKQKKTKTFCKGFTNLFFFSPPAASVFHPPPEFTMPQKFESCLSPTFLWADMFELPTHLLLQHPEHCTSL